MERAESREARQRRAQLRTGLNLSQESVTALTEEQRGGEDLGPRLITTLQHIDSDSTGTVISMLDRGVTSFQGARPFAETPVGGFIRVFFRTRIVQSQVGQLMTPQSGTLRNAHNKFVPGGMKNASKLFQCAGAPFPQREHSAISASNGAKHVRDSVSIATDTNSKEAPRVEVPGDLPHRSRGSTVRQQTGE